MKTTPSAVHSRLAKHYPARVLTWVKRAKWRHDPAVPLSKIDMSRRPGGRDMGKVHAIADAVKAGKAMPPVMLVHTGASKLAIADGYHRTLGHLHAGKKTINALIATGAGKSGPWDSSMHAAKINLSVVDLAGVCTGSGPCDTTPFSASKTSNWVARVGGLPLYIRAIAKALRRTGHDESQSIQLAVGTVQRWARGEGNVTPETRARATAALAEWEQKKAQAHSLSTTGQEAIDLAKTKGALPPLPGSAKPRYPINDHTSLKKAIRAVGRAKTGHGAIRRHIMARANAIGGSHLIPANWTTTGNLK